MTEAAYKALEVLMQTCITKILNKKDEDMDETYDLFVSTKKSKLINNKTQVDTNAGIELLKVKFGLQNDVDVEGLKDFKNQLIKEKATHLTETDKGTIIKLLCPHTDIALRIADVIKIIAVAELRYRRRAQPVNPAVPVPVPVAVPAAGVVSVTIEQPELAVGHRSTCTVTNNSHATLNIADIHINGANGIGSQELRNTQLRSHHSKIFDIERTFTGQVDIVIVFDHAVPVARLSLRPLPRRVANFPGHGTLIQFRVNGIDDANSQIYYCSHNGHEQSLRPLNNRLQFLEDHGPNSLAYIKSYPYDQTWLDLLQPYPFDGHDD